MQRIRQDKRIWLLSLLPLTLLLGFLSARFPVVTEYFYSRSVYPLLAELGGRFFALVPISIAEIVIYACIVSALVWIGSTIRTIVCSKGERLWSITAFLLQIACVVSVVAIWFLLVCGFNYNRLPFVDYAGLDVHPSTVEELAALCDEIVQWTNTIRAELPDDQDGIAGSNFTSYREMARYAAASFPNLAEEYPILGGYVPPPKPVLASRGMSYLDITGVYFPYTFEANVNIDIPDFGIPATMMHELAHFKGFMREQEANFISHLACIKSGDVFFAYSGYQLALVHATNALYAAHPEAYWQIISGVSDAVMRDMRANSAYWQQFETPIAEVASAMNDTYLRVNRQESGVKSYGEMVDLLLADYRRRQAEW